MRVTTALNRMLKLPGALVKDVAFGGEGVVVTVGLRARRRSACSGCGARGLLIKERREKSWRHLDLGASRCYIECRLRRLYCPGCGDVYEAVPCSPTSRRTRSPPCRIDMSAGYEKAIRAPEGLPNAQVCFDPFHVCQLGGKAADQVRRTEYNRHGRSCTGEGKWIKGTRYSLLKNTANQTPKQLAKLADVVLTNESMYRAFLLLGELLRQTRRRQRARGSAEARDARVCSQEIVAGCKLVGRSSQALAT